LKNIWNERNDDDYDTLDEQQINENWMEEGMYEEGMYEEGIEDFSELDYLRNYISHASAIFDAIVRKLEDGEKIPSSLLKSVQTQLASANQWVLKKLGE